MRALLLLAILAVTACKAEEPWPIRPGGGGGVTGTGGGGDDDGTSPDGGVDAETPTSLTGVVCVVVDFDSAPTCGTPAAQGVTVEVLGGASTLSDNTGAFTLATTGTSVTLRVGEDASDGLVSTLMHAAVTGASVEAPVIDEILWAESLQALQETQISGAGLISVVDSAGNPVAGATVTTDASGGSRQYYDDGAGNWDGNATSTGPDGISMILDTLSFTATATLDTRTASAAVPTQTDGIGIAIITLPD